MLLKIASKLLAKLKQGWSRDSINYRTPTMHEEVKDTRVQPSDEYDTLRDEYASSRDPRRPSLTL